jgi:hypothetical protein
VEAADGQLTWVERSVNDEDCATVTARCSNNKCQRSSSISLENSRRVPSAPEEYNPSTAQHHTREGCSEAQGDTRDPLGVREEERSERYLKRERIWKGDLLMTALV